MAMIKITARWSGFTGAPGYTNFFFNSDGTTSADATAAADGVRKFFADISLDLPSTTKIDVIGEAAVIDIPTGKMLDVIPFTPPTQASGGATGGVSAASGALIHWSTPNVRNGRRLRGRTFLVPLATGSFENNGTIIGASLTRIENAANGLRSVPGVTLGVYGRPTFKGASDGVWAIAASARVPDKQVVLRSRRD